MRDVPASPPLLQSWLFESPWFLIVLFVFVAGVLLMTNRGRANNRCAMAAGVCLLLAVVNFFLAQAVTTERETILERTRALVSSTAPLDVAEVGTYFTPDAELVGPDGETWANVATLIGTVAFVSDRFPITAQELFAVAAEVDADQGEGVSLFDVKTRARSANVPALTRWRAEWVLTGSRRGEGDDDGEKMWRIKQIKWLEHESPNGIQPNLGRLR